MPQSFKEMAHILGLSNNPYLGLDTNERWALEPAHQSTKERYSQLTNGDNLNFYLLSNHSTKTITDYIAQMKPGEYMGLLTGWEGHAYSLHAIKGRSQVLFIYVNRGEGHNEEDSDTVKIFPVINSRATNFASQMIDASRADRRMIMAKFLEENEARQDTASSDYIAKTDQGRDNCTIANSNISWHLQLAAKYMQTHGRDFIEAYQATGIKYQEMRRKDQVNAFQFLLNNSKKYPSPEAYFYDYMQALEKFGKGLRGEFLVDELQKNAPGALQKLIRPLDDEDDFISKAQHYVRANKKIPAQDKEEAVDGLLRVRRIILRHYDQLQKATKSESDYDSEEEPSKKEHSESEEELSEYEDEPSESEGEPEKPWVLHSSDDESTRANKNSQFMKHAKGEFAELRHKHKIQLPEDSDDEGFGLG